MNISFLGNWRKKHGMARGVGVSSPRAGGDSERAEGLAQLLSECELLRGHAAGLGVELDDSAESLEALDQLLPRWRDNPEVMHWLGNDAGLYLGTVLVRTVSGARWRTWPNGQPVVELATGRELDVVEVGHTWAQSGTPELFQCYAEASES